MDQPTDSNYYVTRRSELLRQFDEDARRWEPLLAGQYGESFAGEVLAESRRGFEGLIPQLPYIGGDESYTGSLIESARCLAFYLSMNKRGKTAAETGKILYDAILRLASEPGASTPEVGRLTPEQLSERRRARAKRSQARHHPAGYVYEYIHGDGGEFDYGYDFMECAAQKFYHTQGADEFLPYFCFLDFAYSRVYGLGLVRSKTLAEGFGKCDPRFKNGRSTEPDWPPPFLKNGRKIIG